MKLFFSFWFIFVLNTVINSENIYDVTKYGADNKGIHKSTDAIKKTIDAALAKGGGTVLFPAGEYLTGPINLRSHITLHFAEKALVKFSKDHVDYPAMNVKLPDGDEKVKSTPLIYAYGEKNISIVGKGVLDGQGSVWWTQPNATGPYLIRPLFIHLFECKGILLEDITITNSPRFNVNPVFSDDIIIRGITIHNPVPSPNTDGINSNSCRNLTISKVTINTGDDCIALNAGNRGSTKRPSENIHISDSFMGIGHSGVGIGSTALGGVRNLTVTNCVFNGTDRGLYVKTNREKGGSVENLHYSDITMNHIKNEGIVLSMVYKAKGQQAALHDIHNITKQAVTEHTPVIRNIEYKNISGSAKWGIFFVGVPESPIHDIKMTSINIKAPTQITLTNTKNIEVNGKKEP